VAPEAGFEEIEMCGTAVDWTSDHSEKGFVRLDECMFKKCCKKYKKKNKSHCKKCPKR